MKEENRMDNFLGFVYHAEENNTFSCFVEWKACDRSRCAVRKKDILNPHHMNDFFHEKI